MTRQRTVVTEHQRFVERTTFSLPALLLAGIALAVVLLACIAVRQAHSAEPEVIDPAPKPGPMGEWSFDMSKPGHVYRWASLSGYEPAIPVQEEWCRQYHIARGGTAANSGFLGIAVTERRPGHLYTLCYGDGTLGDDEGKILCSLAGMDFIRVERFRVVCRVRGF